LNIRTLGKIPGVLFCKKSEVNNMAEGTSVAKINLQVDLQGDMQKQISEMANNLGSSLKSSLEKATSGMLSGMEKVIDSAMKNINASISEGLEKMKQQTEEFVKSLQSILKKIKVPKAQTTPTNVIPAMNPVIPSVSPRGPPAAAKAPIDTTAIQSEISKVTEHLDLVNQKIEIQQDKLAGLKESYERALNPNLKNKLASQINNTELSILKLTEASDKMGFKLNDLDAKLNGTGNLANKLGDSFKKAGNKIKETAKAATKNVGPIGKTADAVGQRFDKMGRMINSALKRVLIMGTLYKVIRGFMSYLGSALATNQQFSNSLAVVKSNLQVAFIPIYNAILPALNTFMSAISRATAYMASFLSVIFGSTFKASSASAKALNKQKAAIAGVGAASKKAAKDMQLSLAGFDEITNLSTPGADDAGGGGGGGGGASSTAPIVSPGLDLSKFEAGLKNLLDKLDPYFEPIRQAFGRLKEAFEPLKENLFAGLRWLFDKVLVPLGKWTITEVVPRFLDMLANVFKILNNAIEALKPWWSWLWENFYVPLSTWTGGVIITVLDGINAALSKLGDWIGENKTLIENLVIVVASFAAAWALVNGAIAIWTGLQAAYAAVTTISTVVTSAFATAVAFLTSPITLVILAIGALIAIGILLWKNWDKISAWLKKIWEGIKETASRVWNGIVSTIKNVFNGIGEWFSRVFTGAWNGIKNAFSAVGSFFSGIWTTIKNTFTTIGTVIGEGIGNAFKTVVNAIINFAERTINGFIRAINGAIKLINLIPGVSINPLAPLAIPRLATGGVIDQPTIAMVGEAGKEAVMPLERNTEWIDKLASKIDDSRGGGDGGDGEFEAIVDGEVLFRVVMKRLNRKRRQKGLPIIEY
jgi:phage-related protein